MKRLLQATAAVALISAAGCDVAEAAAAACGDRAQMLEQLSSKYGEAPQAIGLTADGGVLEILASPKGGFTILVSYPKRPTCVVAVGSAFEMLTHLAGQPA